MKKDPASSAAFEMKPAHVTEQQPLALRAAAAPLVETLVPGQKGAEPWLQQYGERLLAVRVRVDPRSGERYTSVELLADMPVAAYESADWEQAATQSAEEVAAGDEWVSIKVGLSERQLQRRLIAAGVEFSERTRTWRLKRSQAVALGIESRIA